jgi:alpha-tubulin suppressor-like RCC1 family protein
VLSGIDLCRRQRMGMVRMTRWLHRPTWLVCVGGLVMACGPGKHADGESASAGGTAGDGDHRLVLAPPCAAFDGRVKCWGRNERGQLGLGDTEHRGDEPGEMGDALPFVDLGERTSVAKLAVGLHHSCALFANGRVKCWGNNDYGQLGVGDRDNRGDGSRSMDLLPFVDLGEDTHAVGLAAGDGHTCAVLVDGGVKCWGGNIAGQLGLGHTEDRGGEPGQMGASLPFVDLGVDAQVAEIAAGGAFTCVSFNDGELKCWGANSSGQLGLGDSDNRGDEPGEMGDALPFVDVGGQVVSLGAGNMHTCALLSNGRVECWGSSMDGQLGHEDLLDRDRPLAVDLGSGAHVVQLGVGGRHNCALLADGTARCWGPNNRGQLGIGAYRGRGDEPGDMGDNLPPVDLGSDVEIVRMVPARGNFTCAHLSGDRIKCWGTNRYGELGLERIDDRGVGHEPEHMGDHLPFVDLGFALE